MVASTVRRFRDLRVLVVGDAMLDAYLDGTATKLCAEAPAPVVRLDGRTDLPGGAGNAAVNVAALGASVELVSVVGDDEDGERLREALAAAGVAVDGTLVLPGHTTTAKRRVLAGGQLLVRLDTGSSELLRGTRARAVAESLAARFERADAVLVSDYGCGTLAPPVRAALRDLLRRAPRILTVDARNPGLYRDVEVTAAKPNYAEAVRLVHGQELAGAGARALWVSTNGERILDACGARIAAVTLDCDGAVVVERGRPAYRTYARRTSDVRAIGAGDTFAAALTLALAAGAHTPAAAELASAAAGVVVERERTAVCDAAELARHLGGGTSRVIDRERLRRVAGDARRDGRRVVFTNGCFDLLHRGHITYLNQAKALGDVLVVGLNSDASVRRLKGPERPINRLEDRADVLAALSCVDWVVPFEEDTPAALIRLLRPDVFVKGGDYTRDTLPEAALVEELGGAVHLLPFVRDRSTSGVIEQIRSGTAAAG